MIRLDNVRRTYRTHHGQVTVLKGVDFHIGPGEKVGILGKNGAGKSTMVRLISGAEKPDSGRITRDMSVSWPLAFGGGFQGTLTGLDNLRFICRIYGQNWREHLDFIEDFTELGRFLREPMNTYSSGMRSRLAFALSMVIDFDCFLIDEIMAVGDHRFHERCHVELFEKRGDKAMVFVSHDPAFLREVCTRASVLRDGLMHNFDDLEHGFHYYYSEQPVSSATGLAKEVSLQEVDRPLDQLLFGRDVPGTEDRFGNDFATWLFAHPLNADPEVALHRLQNDVTSKDVTNLQKAFAAGLSSDHLGRSLHSVLAAYAEDRPDCEISRNFLLTFEAPLPLEGPDGLWAKMAYEAGSIRSITKFRHEPTGRDLPLRVDFHRASTPEHVRNELAEFTITENGVICRVQIALPVIYAPRLFATYPFILKYFKDCELSGGFALSLGDEGLSERVLSFCSTIPDFLVPDVLFVSTQGYQKDREAYALARPWSEREDRAYWRGTDTGAFRYRELAQAPRVAVALAAAEHPDMFDAKLTQVELRPGWEVKHDYYVTHGLLGLGEPQERILDFKYQIDVDGNTNSWSGFYLKLLSGSPVLKVESELGFRQWFYGKLNPWRNYVPVAADASDLVEKLQWLRNHPYDAERIGRNGRELAMSIGYEDAMNEASEAVGRLVAINRRMVP